MLLTQRRSSVFVLPRAILATDLKDALCSNRWRRRLYNVFVLSFRFHYAAKLARPNKINSFSGYRAPMSMRNSDAWKFARRYCGRLWRVIGLFSSPLTVLIMLFVMRKRGETIGKVGLIARVTQAILLTGTIFPAELALTKIFDKDGNRRRPLTQS